MYKQAILVWHAKDISDLQVLSYFRILIEKKESRKSVFNSMYMQLQYITIAKTNGLKKTCSTTAAIWRR